MEWPQLLMNIYSRLSQELEEVLDGLTTNELNKRPAPDANTIGWLTWHATRSLDRSVGDFMWGEQLWIKDQWHARFGRPADLNDTGYGHSTEEVASFRIPNRQTLLEYHRAVMTESLRFLAGLSENKLDRDFESSIHPGTMQAVSTRIIGNINDCFQHIGQAAYVRGLLKGHGWLGR